MSQKLDKGQSKKLQEKQRKRLAEQARRAQQRQATRRSNMVTAGIAALVVVAVVALVLSDRDNQGQQIVVPAGVAAAAAGCSKVEQFAEQSRAHIDPGAAHSPYNSTPPTSGAHYGTPADPGFYPTPLPPEQLVHNLEHGQIVIWYDPEAPESAVDGIQALVEDGNRRAQRSGFVEPLLAAPFEGLEQGSTYALTAWRNLQTCDAYSRAAIDDFRAQFQGRGPEQVGVAPFGG